MDGKIKFSTGKEIDPNSGFVGLNELFEISEGYDGQYSRYDLIKDNWEWVKPEDQNTLTVAEQLELCAIMIARWRSFEASIKPQ